jgi:hypothetical protein
LLCFTVKTQNLSTEKSVGVIQVRFVSAVVVYKKKTKAAMPSYASPLHYRVYDRTLHLLGSSMTLVSISEEDEFSDDSTRVVRHNARLSRHSFGNQSFKTGLAELDASRHCGTPPPRGPSPHTSSPEGGWGFFVDE